MDPLLVRTAHADAWEAHGRHRTPYGGGVQRLPGVRLMASGLPYAQWNNGDVSDPAAVDVEAVHAWYADRRTPAGRSVPWGLRVPAGAGWQHGRHLFRKRLMGLAAGDFRPATMPDRLTLRVAGAGDLDAVVAIDSVAFGEAPHVERSWLEPILTQPDATVCLAVLDGQPVGVGNVLVTRSDAGPAAYVAGIGVLPAARGRGVGAAVSSWLVERGLAAGAALAHLHPDTDAATRIYARLGFVEVDGFDVYVDV